VTITIGPTIPQAQVSVLRPDGTTLVSPRYVFSFGKDDHGNPVRVWYVHDRPRPTQTYTGSMAVSLA
jgi:hypothetical protein